MPNPKTDNEQQADTRIRVAISTESDDMLTALGLVNHRSNPGQIASLIQEAYEKEFPKGKNEGQP